MMNKVKRLTVLFSGAVACALFLAICSERVSQAGDILPQFQLHQMKANKLSADSVAQKIWKLPEVQQKAKQIGDLSHHAVSLGVRVSEKPTANQPYYIVQVYESHPDRIVTIWYLRVHNKTGAIAVQEYTTGEYIPLNEWRKQLQTKASVKVNQQAKLTKESKVAIDGIGPIRVGMTVSEASVAAGTKLVSTGYSGAPGCFYFRPQNSPKDVAFMVIGDRIARVDIWRNSPVTTISGARIGDTEERIKSLYPGRIQVSQHSYVPKGHYLTFVPKDPSDKNYRIVFETDGKRVTEYRAGKLPEVQYIEGCS